MVILSRIPKTHSGFVRGQMYAIGKAEIVRTCRNVCQCPKCYKLAARYGHVEPAEHMPSSVPDGYFDIVDGERRLRSPVLFFAPTE